MCSILNNKADCCGCGACRNVCPAGCIEMRADEEGFLYPYIRKEECLSCGLCEKTCPVLDKKSKSTTSLPCDSKAYACISLCDKVREKSSSGGVFSLLAEEVLKEGGKVYGAAFDRDCSVYHKSVDSLEGLCELRGSKYLQSRIGTVYQEVKTDLEKHLPVLFSGTPCQIAGLKSFLQKDYGTLYLADVICHGAPSPLVWELYLKSLEKRHGASRHGESNPSFRTKAEGWIRFSVSIPFRDDTEYRCTLDRDLYMQTFLHNLDLRPSCYQCSFKPSHTISDITLADFWGIQKVMPDMFDDKGTSLVIVNTEKGEQLFKRVNSRMRCKPVDLKQAVSNNQSFEKSVRMPRQRKEFFQRLGKEDLEELMKRLTKDSLYRKFRVRLGQLRRKIRRLK